MKRFAQHFRDNGKAAGESASSFIKESTQHVVIGIAVGSMMTVPLAVMLGIRHAEQEQQGAKPHTVELTQKQLDELRGNVAEAVKKELHDHGGTPISEEGLRDKEERQRWREKREREKAELQEWREGGALKAFELLIDRNDLVPLEREQKENIGKQQ